MTKSQKMANKKIISEEKFFLNFIKKQAPLYGLIGISAYLSDKNKLIEEDKEFIVLDEYFNIIHRDNVIWDGSGNFTKSIKDKLALILPNKQMDYKFGINIEELISDLLTSSNLAFHDKYVSTDDFFKPKDKSLLNIEDSSDEYKHFIFVCRCMQNAIKHHIEIDSFENKDIDYNNFTDKGKLGIDKSIEWFKTNISKTPIQDAWKKVLVKNNLDKNNFTSFDKWCDITVMKKIDYSDKK